MSDPSLDPNRRGTKVPKRPKTLKLPKLPELTRRSGIFESIKPKLITLKDTIATQSTADGSDDLWRDWRVSVSHRSEYERCISGWCVASPQRYFMLTLTLIAMGLIFESLITCVIGLGIALWSARRFRVTISPDQEVSVSFRLIIPYQRYNLPLTHTQVRLLRRMNQSQSTTRSLQATDAVDVVIAHPLLQEPIILLTQNYASGKHLSRIFDQLGERAYQHRQSSIKEPFELFKHEPGEWVISLMELFPQLLLPVKKNALTHTVLSWWSPSKRLCYRVMISIILGLFVTLSAPYLGLIITLLSVGSMVSVREKVIISYYDQSLTWRRSILGVLIAEERLEAPLWVKLEHDLYAPNGRSVTIGGSRDFTSLSLGQPWDAFWIYQEVEKALVSTEPRLR